MNSSNNRQNRSHQGQHNLPEHHIPCTICKVKPIRGFLYACTTKKKVSLCDTCFHTKRSANGLNDDGFHAFYYPNSLDHQIPPKKKFEHKVRCNACSKKPIIGKRYQCKTRSGYDMCETCFPLRAQYGMLNHNWDIYIVPRMISSNYKEKGIIPTHKVKCKGCKKSPIFGKRFKCDTKRNVSLCQPCFNDRERLQLYGENWVVYHRPKHVESRIHEFLPRHKGVFCNYCRVNPIKGTRYFCKTRVNFDLCGHCFSRRDEIRMKNHNWVLYSSPNVVEREIKEQNLVLHSKYRCDNCKVYPIYGPRYECKTTKKSCSLCHACFLTRERIKLKGQDWVVWAAPAIPVQTIYERINKFPGQMCRLCKKKPIYGRLYVCQPKSSGVVMCETCFPKRSELAYSGMTWTVYRAPGVELQTIYDTIGLHPSTTCGSCKTSPIQGKLHRCEKKKVTLCQACWPSRAGKCLWRIYAVPSSVPEIVDEREYLHKIIVCNKCAERKEKDHGKGIKGPRYKCLSHVDFDLCERDFLRRHEFGMFYDHIWCRVQKPGSFGGIIHPPPPLQQQQQLQQPPLIQPPVEQIIQEPIVDPNNMPQLEIRQVPVALGEEEEEEEEEINQEEEEEEGVVRYSQPRVVMIRDEDDEVESNTPPPMMEGSGTEQMVQQGRMMDPSSGRNIF